MNLAFVTIKPNTAYQSLATLSEISFSADTTYVMQVVQGNGLRILEAADVPTKGGFVVFPGEKFQYTAGAGTLYVQNVSNEIDTILNIAE